MKSKTKEEWLNWYKERSGIEDLGIVQGEIISFHPEHGFIVYALDTENAILLSHHTCGDGKYWAKVYKTIMKMFGLKKLIGYTQRNPNAWIRKYGGHIKGYELEVDLDEFKI